MSYQDEHGDDGGLAILVGHAKKDPRYPGKGDMEGDDGGDGDKGDDGEDNSVSDCLMRAFDAIMKKDEKAFVDAMREAMADDYDDGE